MFLDGKIDKSLPSYHLVRIYTYHPSGKDIYFFPILYCDYDLYGKVVMMCKIRGWRIGMVMIWIVFVWLKIA